MKYPLDEKGHPIERDGINRGSGRKLLTRTHQITGTHGITERRLINGSGLEKQATDQKERGSLVEFRRKNVLPIISPARLVLESDPDNIGPAPEGDAEGVQRQESRIIRSFNIGSLFNGKGGRIDIRLADRPEQPLGRGKVHPLREKGRNFSPARPERPDLNKEDVFSMPSQNNPPTWLTRKQERPTVFRVVPVKVPLMRTDRHGLCEDQGEVGS